MKSHSILIILLILALNCLVMADSSATNTVTLQNKPDDIVFINDNLMICADIDGLVKVTAKLEAFGMPDCTRLWFKEYLIGKQSKIAGIKDLPYHFWKDENDPYLYLGNGPLTAIDYNTGEELWTIEYDQTGMVFGLLVYDDVLYVMGTKEKSSFPIAFSTDRTTAIGHLKNPVLLCVEKKSGNIKWKYAYNPPPKKTITRRKWGYVSKTTNRKFPGLYISESNYDDSGSNENNLLYIAGKYVYCLDASSGEEKWIYKHKPNSEINVIDNYLYFIADKKLCCLDLEDGTEKWKSQKKVNGLFFPAIKYNVEENTIFTCMDKKATIVNSINGDIIWSCEKKKINPIQDMICVSDYILALNPGKYDSEKVEYKDKFKIVCLNFKNGEFCWEFNKGENFREWSLINENMIALRSADRMYVIDLNKGTMLANIKIKKYFDVITKETEIIGIGKNGIDCLAFDGKSKRWEIKTKLSKHDNPVLLGQNSQIFYPTKEEGIWVVSLDNGKVIWKASTGKNPRVYFAPSLRYFINLDEDQFQYYTFNLDIGGKSR